jgi:hypothetical protein
VPLPLISLAGNNGVKLLSAAVSIRSRLTVPERVLVAVPREICPSRTFLVDVDRAQRGSKYREGARVYEQAEWVKKRARVRLALAVCVPRYRSSARSRGTTLQQRQRAPAWRDK